MSFLQNKFEKIKAESKRLEEIKILPASKVSSILEKKFNLKLKNTQTMKSLLKMSDIRYKDIQGLESFGDTMNSDIGHLVAIEERYEGYLKRQDQEISNSLKTQNTKIPSQIIYNEIKGLSNEAREKLSEVMPDTLGQASRISGITPAIISLLRIYIKKHSL